MAPSFRRRPFPIAVKRDTHVSEGLMQEGYARIYIADEFQTLDLQMDALSAAGVGADQLRR